MRGFCSQAIAFQGYLALGLLGASSKLWANQPVPWQMGMQPAATPVMEKITAFHTLVTSVGFGIVCVLFIALAYILWRFRASRQKEPQAFRENPWLEVAWTVVPVLILVCLAVPSLKLLFYMDRSVDADLTVKVTGHQWYWTYEYPDHDVGFDSLLETKPSPRELRLLAVDHPLVVPEKTTIRVILTSSDVIHSWAVPAFGIKTDTIPGRLTETWFRATRTGTYYGQCSELCGINHGLMPIAVKVVPKPEFARWLAAEKRAEG